MSQEKLKKFQKELFEYDYTLKKIDTILMSAKLSPEDRELYQLNRESCQKLKSQCSREMSEYAKQNRLSLLLPPLSKEEKDSITQSMDERTDSDPPVSIRFDNIREDEIYSEAEEVKEIEEREGYKTMAPSSHRDGENKYDGEEVSQEDSEIIEFLEGLKEGMAIFYGSY